MTDNINGVLSTANTLRTDFDAKLGALKNAILDKVAEFQQDFTCENADKISEIKFVSENLQFFLVTRKSGGNDCGGRTRRFNDPILSGQRQLSRQKQPDFMRLFYPEDSLSQ